MSISPKSFEARQQASTDPPSASQSSAAFGQPPTSPGSGPIGFGNPAGFGTLGTAGQSGSGGMSQAGTAPTFNAGNGTSDFGPTGPFGQPFSTPHAGNPVGFGQQPQASATGSGQVPQAGLQGFGQQPQFNFAGFGQQPQASSMGFGAQAQAQQQGASAASFSFGQAAVAGEGPAHFHPPQAGIDVSQQPVASFPQQPPAFSFGNGSSAAQPFAGVFSANLPHLTAHA